MSVATTLAIIVVFFAAAGAFFGMIRGFGRSFLRIITVFAAFLGSAYICRALVADTDRILHSGYLTRLLNRFGVTILARIEAALPDVFSVIFSLPLAILAPILFVVLFFLLSSLLMLIYGILAAFIFPKRRRVWSPVSNLFGAIVGVAQGAVIALVLMVPVVGLVEVAGDAIDVVAKEQSKYESGIVTRIKGYRGKLDEAEKSLVFAYAKRLGAERISDSLTTFSYKDEFGKTVTVTVKDELVSIAGMYAHAMPLIGTDIEKYGDDQVAAVERLAGDFGKSKLLTQIIANLVAGACTEWKDGDKYLGMEPLIQGDGEVGNFLEVFYDSFDDSTSATIASDFETIADIFRLFVAHNVFASLDDTDILQVLFTDPTLLEELFDIMDTNPRTHALHTALIDLSVKAFCSEHVSVPTEGDENYEEYQSLLGSVADTLNELDSEADLEAKLEAVKEEFGDALLEYGVTEEKLSSTVVEAVSDMLINEFGDILGSVTPEDIENFITGQKFNNAVTE